MIMVQKPIHLQLSSPTSHRRHPSAPPAVLIQSTRTPGLLSLSKPAQSTPPRPQQHQQQQRIPRPAQKGKSASAVNHRSPQPAHAQAQPVDDAKKPAGRKDDVVAQSAASASPSPAPEKAPRGRQNLKPTKEKSTTRSTSRSAARKTNRRQPHHHQGSPPQTSNSPSQAEVSNTSKRTAPTRSQSLQLHDHNLFDPFLVNSSDSESDGAPTTTSKPAPVRSSPKLATRPTGKLARRRQNIPEAPGTPTPSKAVPVPRGSAGSQARETGGHPALNLSRSVPVISSMVARPTTRQFTPQPVTLDRDLFPVCDDLTDAEDEFFAPSTPVRSKAGAVTWQQSLVYDDGPRTAPLSSAFPGFPFPSNTSTPISERKRHHFRSPSEGMFNMSMDEDSSFSSSSSDASEELKAMVGLLSRRRVPSGPSTPGLSNSSKKDRPGFFASSIFQNSPSPDDLPAPAFGL
ncbi:hypothetical protein BV25DRAFT_1837053 [Artomyces pyxidatus]|uniref:Uncharacterized protein n=1 Tax=Artomyces pyxidatus TaxID=48021 RepID=A0ACB8T8L1_9AGAM|nr:hypothetical protein BV25DRAFT_1837053 [Artomyces pyxidatus]